MENKDDDDDIKHSTLTQTIPETAKRHKEFLQHTHAYYKIR
jgi:hypothetical protein